MDLVVVGIVILNAIFIAMLLITGIDNEKYVGYRKKAFTDMKKTKILLYCIPLFLSMILTFGLNQLGVMWSPGLVIICIGILAGFILFDNVESKRIKSGANTGAV